MWLFEVLFGERISNGNELNIRSCGKRKEKEHGNRKKVSADKVRGSTGWNLYTLTNH